MAAGGAPDLGGTTAAILAGGLGSRLRAAIADRPKVLAEVSGRPFLAYLLDQLAAAGVRRAVLCTGYRGAQVEAAFGPRHRQLELCWVREAEPLGTGGALRHALPQLDTDPVLVMNGDSYSEVDLVAMLRWHRAQGASGTLVLARVDDTLRYGRVETDAGGAVTSFVEKGTARGPGRINAGIYLLPAAWIAAIDAGRAVSFEREVLPARIGEGLLGWDAGGRFLDIGTPDSYASAAGFFARAMRPSESKEH